MTRSVPSVQMADDAFAPALNDSPAPQASQDKGGFDAAASGHLFDQSQSKTHQMHALLARAAEAGQFDGNVNGAVGQAALQRVLVQLESAKIQLDRVRLRG